MHVPWQKNGCAVGLITWNFIEFTKNKTHSRTWHIPRSTISKFSDFIVFLMGKKVRWLKTSWSHVSPTWAVTSGAWRMGCGFKQPVGSFCQRVENRASSRARFWKKACVTGSGWVGCVNVHVNLRHMHMLRHILGWGEGWGVLTFMLTCVTCTCYVTSWVGGGGVC